MSSTLKIQIQDAMKMAMKQHEKERLGTIRLILAALKQKEVDERIELTDTDILAILDKMLKQRRESIHQYQAAQRQDLVDQEQFEIGIIQSFMPAPLSESEIAALLDAAFAQTEAKTISDMNKVMAIIKPQVQGRADMGKVGQLIKQRLA